MKDLGCHVILLWWSIISMDKQFRLAERRWQEAPIVEHWIRLLRLSEAAGQPRFTLKGLIDALGPGEVIGRENTPTGFKAKIRNGIYPHRKHVRDLTTNSGYPLYEIHEDYETVRDTTNWDGWVEVAWRDDDDEPELQIQVEESWEFGEERHGDKIITRDYRYYGNSVTNDEELNAAMFDYDKWESMD